MACDTGYLMCRMSTQCLYGLITLRDTACLTCLMRTKWLHSEIILCDTFCLMCHMSTKWLHRVDMYCVLQSVWWVIRTQNDRTVRWCRVLQSVWCVTWVQNDCTVWLCCATFCLMCYMSINCLHSDQKVTLYRRWYIRYRMTTLMTEKDMDLGALLEIPHQSKARDTNINVKLEKSVFTRFLCILTWS
jgi:hypothetical protein